MQPLKAFILALCLNLPAHFAPAADLDASLRALLNRYAQQVGLSGTLAVVTPERSFAKGVGGADDRKGELCGPDTIYLIASNSKQFVSAAILKLEEEGKLRLDEEVARYLPEYPRENLTLEGKSVTVRHLLQHVSGVPDAYADERIRQALFEKPIEFQELLDAIKDRPLVFRPESRWEYSNTGYILLGELVRRRSGMSYGEYLQSRFFRPLGLTHSSVGFPGSSSAPLAKSYVKTDQGREDFISAHGIKEPHVSDVFTDGNIFTTVGDLTKWVLALTGGQVLSVASIEKMFTPSPLKDYGFGWVIKRDAKGRTMYSHTGYWLGYMSFMAVFPGEHVAVVWLSNQLQSEEITLAFLDEVLATAVP